MDKLLHSSKFWLAVFTIVSMVLQTAFPQVPASIWDALRVFALAVISVFTVQDVAVKLAGFTSAAQAISVDENPLTRLWASIEFRTLLVGMIAVILSVGFGAPPDLVNLIRNLFAALIGVQGLEKTSEFLSLRAK